MAMEGTRVDRRRPERAEARSNATPPLARAPAAGRDDCPTQPIPVEDERTRLKPAAAGPRGLASEERVALFAHALAKDGAQALLDGFSSEARERAQVFLSRHVALPSAERQGRLASEFGVRVDASVGLREVWEAAGPALRREIYALLPPYHRTLFPEYALPQGEGSADEAPPPGLRAFAERLVREATRR